MSNPSSFSPWIARWNLVPDGAAIETHTSQLLPVCLSDGTPAMLKCPQEHFERMGALLMRWWDGRGAANVLASDADGTLLLERLSPDPSLLAMAHASVEEDDAATRILCAAAARLHAPRGRPLPPGLIRLADWFRGLWPEAERHGGVLRRAAEAARFLLASPESCVALHGDLHHANVMQSSRGWLAIDPKPLHGEHGFDFANIVCNPDVVCTDPAPRFARQMAVIAETTKIDRERLRLWVLAYAGLSASWSLADGNAAEAAHPLMIAELAAAG